MSAWGQQPPVLSRHADRGPFGDGCAHCGTAIRSGLYCTEDCSREARANYGEQEADGEPGCVTAREALLRMDGIPGLHGMDLDADDDPAEWAAFNLETLCNLLDAAMPAFPQRPWRERCPQIAVVPGKPAPKRKVPDTTRRKTATSGESRGPEGEPREYAWRTEDYLLMVGEEARQRAGATA